MSPEQQKSGGGFVQAIAKRALAPLLATAVAFLVRKLTDLWQEQVQPKLEEKGGVASVAREEIDSVGEKLPSTEQLGEVTEKLGQVKEKVGSGASQQSEAEATEDSDRDEERRRREQRREQRRRSLEQARSS